MPVHLSLGSRARGRAETGTRRGLNTQNKCQLSPNCFLGEGGKACSLGCWGLARHPPHLPLPRRGLLGPAECRPPSPAAACTTRFTGFSTHSGIPNHNKNNQTAITATSPPASHCAKCATWPSCVLGAALIVPILQMRTAKHREVKKLVPGHSARE